MRCYGLYRIFLINYIANLVINYERPRSAGLNVLVYEKVKHILET